MGCRQVYPLKIVRQLDKSYEHPENHLENVITNLQDNDFCIKHFVGDNLKRATAKKCLNHASLWPCEYCFAKGHRYVSKPRNLETFTKKIEMRKKIIQEKVNELINNQGSKKEIQTLKSIEKDLIEEEKVGNRTKTNIVWPAVTRDSETRTDPKIMDIIERIEADPNLSKEEKKGVVGRSPLWNIPTFNFVRDSPAEYLHSVCIGVVKRLIILTFSVGENRPRITKRKLSSTEHFNQCMLETQVPREFSRRARRLDFSVMKGQEMRNICLFFFPYVLQCLEPNAKERKLWLLLTYNVRACILPTEEFDISLIDDVEKASNEFYMLYEALFGDNNCSYNTHIVGSHLMDMRAHGPLTETSAFVFESFYGEMRNAFAPGTQSTLKQIMEKVLVKRAISFHSCEAPIFYSDHDSPMECNCMIYCYESNVHKMYKIIGVDKDSLVCYPQGKFNFQFKETSQLNLNWSKVGVYKKGGIMESPVIISKNKVSGKVLKVGEYLITCPNNVLREK